MGTGVNSVHKALKTRSQNIRGAAFTELVRRVSECKVRKLGRRLTKNEVEGIMSTLAAVFIITKQTPRSENINKVTSRWVEAICNK
jgi:urease accessory protein UreF